MPNITFYRKGISSPVTVSAESGDSILTAARKANLIVDSPCNGNGTCGKCLVNVRSTGLNNKTVLACATPADREMQVELIDSLDNGKLQIKHDGLTGGFPVERNISKHYISETTQTAVYFGGNQVGTEPGNTSGHLYGIVVDIGTTTLVTALIDLADGRELATAGALNPQSRQAQDVLSRIRYAADENGLEKLQKLLIQELNRLIAEMTESAKVKADHIYEIVLCGNTCMLHLAAGINPASLGKYPYTPSIRGDCKLPASQLGITAAPLAEIYLPPIISAYVGADITAGMLVAGLDRQSGTTLFIDIGTNGEMVLASGGRLAATSTAAGPAFEGMNISQGMRAAPGAVEAFRFGPDGIRIVNTIGGQNALGICGSGLLDIVAQLITHGLVGKNGRFSQKTDSCRSNLLTIRNNKLVFEVADGIYLSQQDIRQVQLAKGAIRAGVEALLSHQRISANDVDKVLIAGSFGYHLNPESLLAIGLLPKEFADKIEFLGNTSKSGGHALLVNEPSRDRIRAASGDVSVVELTDIKDFDRLFVKCLDF